MKYQIKQSVQPKTRKRKAERRKFRGKKMKKAENYFLISGAFLKIPLFSNLKRGIPQFKKNQIKRGKFRGKKKLRKILKIFLFR